MRTAAQVSVGEPVSSLPSPRRACLPACPSCPSLRPLDGSRRVPPPEDAPGNLSGAGSSPPRERAHIPYLSYTGWGFCTTSAAGKPPSKRRRPQTAPRAEIPPVRPPPLNEGIRLTARPRPQSLGQTDGPRPPLTRLGVAEHRRAVGEGGAAAEVAAAAAAAHAAPPRGRRDLDLLAGADCGRGHAVTAMGRAPGHAWSPEGWAGPRDTCSHSRRGLGPGDTRGHARQWGGPRDTRGHSRGGLGPGTCAVTRGVGWVPGTRAVTRGMGRVSRDTRGQSW